MANDKSNHTVVDIRRHSATVAGGHNFSFAALVVYGDQQGNVGFGRGKAKEVPSAIQKGKEKSQKAMRKFPMTKSRTIHCPVVAKYKSSKVYIWPAPEGTGVIACKKVRAFLELLGIKNAFSKIQGSRNTNNVIKATSMALAKIQTPSYIAKKLGKYRHPKQESKESKAEE